MKKTILFLCIFLLFIPLILAYNDFVCYYDKAPEISPFSSFNWFCNITGLNSNENIKCLSYTNVSGDILDVNPKSKDIDTYGRIDSFFNNYGIVNIGFDSKNLIANINITGCVICSNSSGFSISKCYDITPKYKGLESITARSLWIGENSKYIILIGGFLFLCLILFVIFKWVVGK